MTVPARHILEQRPVIAALARAVANGALRKKRAASAPVGERFSKTVAPPSDDLIRDYVRLVGGDPGAYKNAIPPHLFPHWAFPLILRALDGVPYPPAKIVNGGCTLEIHADLPRNEPLRLTAELANIDDNGRRAILTVNVTTETDSAPNALAASFRALVPLASGKRDKRSTDKPRIPSHAREVAAFRFGRSAGLDFAKATGDFNPIHWAPAYARAMGFRSVILHGFGSMSWSMEGLVRSLFAGNPKRLTKFDANFTRPLVLPNEASLYVWGDEQVGLGAMPGGPAYMLGSFRTR